MSILLDASTRVIVHGASSSVGRYQLARMREYHTRVVGVVSRSAPADIDIATYSTIGAAQAETGADLLVSYASGHHVGATAIEAFEAGVRTVVTVAEDVRFRDIVRARSAARASGGTLIGPNTNGILTPGEAVVGMFAPEFGLPGSVGVISRSGTLGYGVLLEMQRVGIGQSTVVGIGGGLARGFSAADALRLFDGDPRTDLVVVLGETGSQEEEELAALITSGVIQTPVIALIVGAVGHAGQMMGHAGAVAYGSAGTYAGKVDALRRAGVTVAAGLGELADAILGLVPLTASHGKAAANEGL